MDKTKPVPIIGARLSSLKDHHRRLNELKGNLTKAHQEFNAYNQVFMEWLAKELGIDSKANDVLLTEILTRWESFN